MDRKRIFVRLFFKMSDNLCILHNGNHCEEYTEMVVMKINRIRKKTKQGKAIIDTTETLSGRVKSSQRNSAESPLLSVRTSHPHPKPLSNHNNCFPRRRSQCAAAAAVPRRHTRSSLSSRRGSYFSV